MEIKINENSCIIDGVEYVKKEQKEQQIPKDGEVWSLELDNKWIIIVKSWGGKIRDYCAYSISTKSLYLSKGGDDDVLCSKSEIKKPQIATTEETKLLHSKLAENGKRWNAEKKCLEDLPKELKKGDLVIVWGLHKENAIIGKLRTAGAFQYELMSGLTYKNAIPFESIEQYKQFITVHES